MRTTVLFVACLIATLFYSQASTAQSDDDSGCHTDLVFVLDSSGSIRDTNPDDNSHDNWQVLLGFIVSVVGGLEIGQAKTRVGVVIFSDVAQSLIYLNEITNKNELTRRILELEYVGAGTNVSGGIRDMHVNQFTAEKGDRPNVQNVAVVITDGSSTIDESRTTSDALAARMDGIRIVVFGITNNVDEDELRMISSEPQQVGQNYFTAETIYGGTFDYADIIGESICNQRPPELGGVYPRYGPKAGGTVVTLTGERLNNVARVVLSPDCTHTTDCDTTAHEYDNTQFIHQENTQIVVETIRIDSGTDDTDANVTSASMLWRPYHIELNVAFAVESVDTGVVFEYRPNPIIETVRPRRTFLAGGIKLDVTGKNLNSVFAPTFLVHMEIRDYHTSGEYGIVNVTTFVSDDVTVINSQSMEVLTPRIDINEDFVSGMSTSGRAKRDISLNTDSLEFYIGFQLDGEDRYANLSNTHPDEGTILVYANPTFEPFDETRLFNPETENHLEFKGERLTLGASLNDYTVQLGKDNCEVSTLWDNLLLCLPPETEPTVEKSGAFKSGKPRAYVHVGHHQVLIGHVDYVVNHTLLIVLCCSMFGSLILAIIVTLLCCKHQGRKADIKKRTSGHDRNKLVHNSGTSAEQFDFTNAAFPKFIE